MNDEYLLVEFLIVPRPPSLGPAGGNDATVSCFKDDMNMQMRPEACVGLFCGVLC